ncbi:MAG: InlB B-repeat-containing protein [Clostridia bacterium]|nr:InlB B-repeat-containing protein [Clostridia bacterium]
MPKLKKFVALLCSFAIALGCVTGILASELEKVDKKVVDISQWNNIIDWSKLSSSVDGAILRIGYRGSQTHKIAEDKLFYEHYTNAAKYSVPVGCYFYTYAYSVADAVEEAKWIISTIKKYNCRFEMPIYFDFEAEILQGMLNNRLRTDMAKAFCKTLADEGFYAGIYANKYWATSLLYMNELSDYTVWLAQYNTTCTYNGTYDMWQYTDSGAVDGVKGKVDISKCYVDFPKYIKENGYNLFADSPVVPEPEPASYNSKCGTYKTLKSVNVKSKAGDGFGTVGSLPASAEVYVSQAGNDWGKISFGNSIGWIKLDSSVKKSSDYISIAASVGFYEVNTQNLNIRTGPSTSYSKNGQLHLGEKVFIFKADSGWGSFYYGSSQVGWISLEYADFVGTVSFNSGIGEGIMEPQQAKTGQSVKLQKCAFAAAGYKFDGWAEKSGGSVKYADSASVKIGSSNVVLYAVFTKNIASKVEFKSGANVDASAKVITIADKKLTAEQFKNNYVVVSGSASAAVSTVIPSRVGTGTVVTVNVDGVKTVYTVAVKGDTNSDGACDSLDLADVLALTQGTKKSGAFSAAQLSAMDVTGDGKINSQDVEKFKNAAYGLAVL